MPEQIDLEQYKRDHPESYVVPPPDATFCTRVMLLPLYPLYYFKRMNNNFGWRFLVQLTSAYFGIKGFLYNMIATAMVPFFLIYLQIDAVEYQMLQNIAWTPWSMKAFFGMISDVLPIGYVWQVMT